LGVTFAAKKSGIIPDGFKLSVPLFMMDRLQREWLTRQFGPGKIIH
jgi:hypothetical protein